MPVTKTVQNWNSVKLNDLASFFKFNFDGNLVSIEQNMVNILQK